MLNITAATRKKVYRLTQAALALAVLYGLTSADYAALWLVLVGAVIDLAVRNVPPAE